ncbi:MAG TPA: DUF1207 domain-containing protein [Methylomirabilota bacterium]|jgi:hypothetical protein
MGRCLLVLALWSASLWAAAPVAAAPAPDDPYLAGYAGAILEREFKVSRRAVTVEDGVLTLDGAQLAGADRARILTILAAVPGVGRVEVREPAGIAAAGSPALTGPTPLATTALPIGFLPVGHLFQPLLADPRWPHFSAAYRYYLGHRDFDHVGAVSFGETIPLFRGNAFADSQWEAGIQAGVFAMFEMDAPSKDLVNADYFASLFGTWRGGPLSALGRLFHQSSHLGDEFLLRTRVDRVNLTYESVDLKLSYDLPWGLRLYGGGGYLFDQEPASLKPWSTQGGVEFRSPWALAAGRIRPVAALDLQSHEENKWNVDVSLRGGVQLESVRVLERNLQILLEYFHGNSPDGQFYRRRVEYVGVGAHFHF